MATHPQGGNFIATPWMLGQITQKAPASLRESALQIAYLSEWSVWRYSRIKQDTWRKVCAQMRLHQPKDWAALCRHFQIDVEAITPQKRSA